MKRRNMIRKFICVFTVLAVVVSSYVMTASAAVIKGKTGIGMAEWALRAYNEGWEYVYGGSSEGKIDCSGLIRSYCNGRGGGAKALLDASSESGNIKDMPRVHGLGLWCEGHAGVYVGKSEKGVDMVVDARNSRVDVVYSELNSRSWSPWVKWFKIGMISYPDTGWFDFNGSTYYYHKGEFVVGLFTVDGVTYDFGKSGALKGEAEKTEATTSTTTATTSASTTKTTTATKKTTTTTQTSTTAAVSSQTAVKTTKVTTTTQTTTEKSPENTVLRFGSRSDEVLKLQKRLVELGYLGASPSGYYGTQTEAAVKLFQKAAGLETDGVAGKETQELLYSENAPAYGTATQTTTQTTTVTTTTAESIPTTTQTWDDETEATNPTEISESDAVQEPQWEDMYNPLDIGSSGEDVTALQEMLKSIGLYEQPLTSYYGSFTRDAVKAFQANIGIEATGTADAYTQYLLFSGIRPENTQNEMEFGDEYFEFGGDLYDSLGVSSDGTVIGQSEGLSAYSKKAAPELFMSRYGMTGGLATLGAFSQSEPLTIIYKNGEAYEIDGETMNELSDSIFN